MPSGLKLVVVGGGSSYTPELISGIIHHASEVPVEQIVLVDIAAGLEKLRIVRDLSERMMRAHGLKISVQSTTDRRAALVGADVVFSQIRVGGMKARARDERIPLKYGVVGQETVGPGGFAKAIRTIPQMLAIAHDIEEICPEAWLLNFTNPAGMVTEALSRYSPIHTIGLCNVPINIQIAIAQALSVERDRVRLKMFGLNHLSFVKTVWLDDEDITALVLSFLAGQGASPANIDDVPWSSRLIEAIQLIPNDYLRYYWMTREMLRRQREDLEAGQGTRAIQVMAIEAELFRRYRDPALSDPPAELKKRGGAYYSEVAAAVMASLAGGQPREMVVNVPNHGAIEGLPDAAVVEVTCQIDTNGAEPLRIGAMDLPVRGLIQQVKAYEQLTIEAAVNGNKHLALAALLANPLVPGAEVAADILDDILGENQADLPREWSR